MSEQPDEQSLLTVANVSRHYRSRSLRGESVTRAVDGVDLEVQPGEILGIAGESGCGKSTLARLICGLAECTAGRISFEGRAINDFDSRERKAFRRKAQMVFQDPDGFLNPRKKIGDLLAQPFEVHGIGSKAERRERMVWLLERVKLSPAEYYLGKYPHELSGGAKQRVGIARALALEPRLIVADEPVASLDMSIRGAILTLLREINQELGLSVILISHDLNVLRAMCSRVAIMYLGKIVEIGATEEVFDNQKHHYTNALLSLKSMPDPTRARNRRKLTLAGEVPSASNPPSGCRFHPRCPAALDVCAAEEPRLDEMGQGHRAACHNPVRQLARDAEEEGKRELVGAGKGHE